MSAPAPAEIIAELDGCFSRGGLARLLGVTEKTLWSWGKGESRPHPRHRHALERLHELLPEIRAAARAPRGHPGRAERLVV